MSATAGRARLTRRGFLTGFGLGMGALVVPVGRDGGAAGAATGPARLGALIAIGADGRVTVFVGATEMGQGVHSGFAQIVADEIGAAWSQMRAVAAPAHPLFANPLFGQQLTAGSTSTRGWFLPLRRAAADARERLITAGARHLRVPRGRCVTRDGHVVDPVSGAKVGFGVIAPAAARLPAVANAPLKARAAFRLIGRSVKRLDLPAKVDGSAIYGIDVRPPGLVHAAIRHAPRLGARLVAPPAKPAGAIAVVPLGNAFAVVAADTWTAQTLAASLSARWSGPTATAGVDTPSLRRRARDLMVNGTALVAEAASEGSSPTEPVSSHVRWIDATYELPFLSHVSMEPLTATALVERDRCVIWASTQAQGATLATAMRLTGLPASKITVNTTFLGGGNGRKIEQDFIGQAIRIAKAVRRPVKLTWSREEDFKNGQYRPMALMRVRAGALSNGTVTSWTSRNVSQSILGQRIPGFNVVDSQAVDGSVHLRYRFGERRVEWVRQQGGVPVGFWRSVGHSINCFAVESAIDELALLTSKDPLAFRLGLLAHDAAATRVLRRVAALSEWASPVAPGRARGLAFSECFGSLIAQVAEVSLPSPKAIKVHRVSAVMDCGLAINPDSVKAQIEGGILHGMTAALWGHMRFARGVAGPEQFSDDPDFGHRMARLADTPELRVEVLSTGDRPGGVGEPGVPPIGPALANALARLTGRRARRLPLMVDLGS
jgi:isoquinoline 1-oxidoreductase beta subunit